MHSTVIPSDVCADPTPITRDSALRSIDRKSLYAHRIASTSSGEG